MNASSSKVSNLKKCAVCKRDKKIYEFRKRKPALGGGYYSTCTECKKRLKDSMESKKMATLVPPVEIDPKDPIKLDFLLDLDGWTTDEIKVFLLTVKKYKSAPYRMKLPHIYKKFFPGRGVSNCSLLLTEFKEAARKGLTFDQYIKEGRKFRRDGKRVLAVPGK